MEGAHGGRTVSALMDGELDLHEAGREITRLKADASLRDTWDTYHLIGDALRGTTVRATGFSARVSQQLAAEPTVLVPRARVQHTRGRRIQTYALSAAASVAAVAVVGWVALSTLKPGEPVGSVASAPAREAQPTLTAAPAAVVAVQPPGRVVSAGVPAATVAGTLVVVPAEAEDDHEYLLAHQGISPTTAIQGVAPYIRTVSSGRE